MLKKKSILCVDLFDIQVRVHLHIPTHTIDGSRVMDATVQTVTLESVLNYSSVLIYHVMLDFTFSC